MSATRQRLERFVRASAGEWNRIGEQTAFYAKTLGESTEAVRKYRVELTRLIAQMGLGVGALALVGGAVVVVSFVVMGASSVVAIVGYSQFSNLSLEALIGFFSAYVNPRLVSPLIAAIGLAITIGAGATAQLGAMRINEEMDALEVMGIRAIAYLASTRVIAGVIVVIPLFCVSLIAGIVTTQMVVLVSFGQSVGVYEHYFNTFLRPTDVIWALVQVTVQGTVIMLVCTYYGFNATGGPAGVGEATGRAVRAALVAATTVTMIVGMILYGRSGGFNLTG
ncbi:MULTISPECIES: ABC transporter permease [unclassified Mycobacterium]|uniref:ABC transporter permease n=1 Tax=unclassified Mycobacterium TaxID=2642494 RepID=UPI00074048D2|nr:MULTISPECIES: ABC transporter permease [unclassified Mycobacterium]KUH83134.1 ABC transporter permease [Mycobacterium sp. GA-0227b]KUH84456.1 ABC transporter permease [Mycobacterium sp. GA-1999]KUH89408.1 ABC transporter permease [Mycobacterium sp. IS-1556]